MTVLFVVKSLEKNAKYHLLWFILHDNEDVHQRSYLLYMADLKLYANSNEEQQEVIHITKQFSNSIHMNFELDVCRILHILRGELVTAELEYTNEHHIEAMAIRF